MRHSPAFPADAGNAVLGHQLLIAVVNGFTLDETGDRESASEQAPSDEDVGEIARGYVASLPRERFPNLVELSDAFASSDQDSRFGVLIDIFIDGLAKRADA